MVKGGSKSHKSKSYTTNDENRTSNTGLPNFHITNPFTKTPVKKLFYSLRPTLGKRCRNLEDSQAAIEWDCGELDPVIDTPPSVQREVLPLPQSNKNRHRRTPAISESSPASCMAIANEDDSENAVVISTLSGELPFCCHADLLTMSRGELVETARVLNIKLPHALQIDVSEKMGTKVIRESIEVIVGIQAQTQNAGRRIPNAPKALKIVREEDEDAVDHMDSDTPSPVQLPRYPLDLDLYSLVDTDQPTPPTSPLAHRSLSNTAATARQPRRLLAAYAASPRLSKLTEEEEDEERLQSDRPHKRKRVSLEGVGNIQRQPEPVNQQQPSLTNKKVVPKPGLPRSRTLNAPSYVSGAAMSRIPRRAVSNPLSGGRSGGLQKPQTRVRYDANEQEQVFLLRSPPPIKSTQERRFDLTAFPSLSSYDSSIKDVDLLLSKKSASESDRDMAKGFGGMNFHSREDIDMA